MARVDSAGSPDAGFGGVNGIVQTGIEATFFNNTAPGVVVLADGKILLAGTTPRETFGSRFSVFRFHADGTVDSTFGTNGRTDVSFTSGTFQDRCRDMAVYSDGKILLVGGAPLAPFGSTQPALARLLPDGSLDPTFSDDGKISFTLNNNSGCHYLTRVLVLPDERILAAGFDLASGGGDFFLVRYVFDPTGVEAPEGSPIRLLSHAVPNPSRGEATLHFRLDGEQPVRVDIFDSAGRVVRRLFHGRLPAGAHALRWDGRDNAGAEAPAGVFFTRVTTPQAAETGKLVRLR